MKDNYADELINMKLPTNDLAGVNILVTGANGGGTSFSERKAEFPYECVCALSYTE